MTGFFKRAILGALNRAGYVLLREDSYARFAASDRQLREVMADLASKSSRITPFEAGAASGANAPNQGVTAPISPTSSSPSIYTPVYDYDGLRTDPAVIHNHEFMKDPRYMRAFALAHEALGHDHPMYWRLHVALWCAASSARLPGDFVECGVWRGFLSTAILSYLDWPRLAKTFFLFDTFNGLDESLLTEEELANRQKLDHFKLYYTDCYDFVCRHFSAYERVRIVRGSVPDTLPTVEIDRVSFLSIDMNCAEPEIAAANYFWERLVPGAIVLLDDYGFVSYEGQKRAFDRFAAARGIEILALPTGQGLIVKP